MSRPDWRLVLAAPDGALLQTLVDHLRPILAQAPHAPELLAVQHPEQLPPNMGPTPVFLMADGPPAALDLWRTWLHQCAWPYQVVYGLGPEGLTNLAHALAADERFKGLPGLLPRTEVAPRWRGVCERCADPACEHRLFSQLRGG
jgi:hypothetical protein